MPKRLSYLLTLLASLLLCGVFIAAKAPTAAPQYDYISVVQVDDHLEISSTAAKFEDVKFKKDTRGYDNNFTALLSKVNELQGQGYELVQNDVYTLGTGSIARNYMLLRRPK